MIYIVNSKVYFLDMKIMSRTNDGDRPADSLFSQSPPFLRNTIFIRGNTILRLHFPALF